MCYMDTYNCIVECVNTELNTTSAMGGTIEGMRQIGMQSCHIRTCEIVSHYSEAIGPNLDWVEPLYHILITPPFLLLMGVLIAVNLYMIYKLWREKK